VLSVGWTMLFLSTFAMLERWTDGASSTLRLRGNAAQDAPRPLLNVCAWWTKTALSTLLRPAIRRAWLASDEAAFHPGGQSGHNSASVGAQRLHVSKSGPKREHEKTCSIASELAPCNAAGLTRSSYWPGFPPWLPPQLLQRVPCQSPLGNREGRPGAMTCEPGDLPTDSVA